MAISGSNVATVGPIQDIAWVPVDIGAVGPNGETSGKALVVSASISFAGFPGLTNTELRAAPVPVSGTFWQATQPVSIAGTVTTTGPLTNNQLRADPVDVQASALPLPLGASTEATLAAQSAKLPASVGAKAANASLSVSNSYMTAAVLGDGSVNTAESITVPNTVQLVEFFNLSANVIWGSWVGTAAANTTGSFPIPALASGVAGYYSAPPGASGTLSIIAVGGASVFTCVGWS